MFLTDLSRRVAGRVERQKRKFMFFFAMLLICYLCTVFTLHDIVCKGFSNVVAPHCTVTK